MSVLAIPPSHAVSSLTVWLARLVAVAYVVIGIVFFVFGSSAGANAVGFTLLAGAVLVAVGLYEFRRTSPWLAVWLVTLGALAGAAMLSWTILVPIAAVALTVLVVRGARRISSVAAGPAD